MRSGGGRSIDGVRVVASGGVRKSVWLVAAAFALVAFAVLLLVLLSGGATDAPPAVPPSPPSQQPTANASPDPEQEESRERTPLRPRRIDARPATDSGRPAVPAEPPAREDAPFAFGPPGEKSGMALFPPHGTKPIRIGIVVPEDFELPEGYLRHFQTTDEGEMLEPILTFHPDYEWVDGEGRAIALPADRVVPPELAPDGMPIRMLEPPGKSEDGAR